MEIQGTAGKIPPQNLIRQVKAESPAKRPGFYKAIVFDVLTVASAAWLGYAYKGWLLGSTSFSIALASAAAFSVFSALQVFLGKEFGRRFFILLLQAAAFLSFFYGYDIKVLIAAAVIIVVLPFWGEVLGRRELEASMKVRFFRTSKPVLAKWTTALLVVFVLLYIPQAENNLFVSRENFDGFADWAAGVIGLFYPEVDLNAPFGTLVGQVAEAQLGDDPQFRMLGRGEKDALLSGAAAQIAESLSKGLGVEISADSRIADVFYDFIVKTLGEWRERFGNFFLGAWGLALFLTMRGFGTIFYAAISFLSFIIYQIMLVSNFMHIIGETRTHEVIEW